MGNNVAEWSSRIVVSEPADDHELEPGSYSSSLVAEPGLPPVTSTLPFGNSVAVWLKRASFIGPADDHVLATGSYNSALAWSRPPFAPPATSTFPFGNNVAVWYWEEDFLGYIEELWERDQAGDIEWKEQD